MQKKRKKAQKNLIPSFLADYPALSKLNGTHDLRKYCPEGYVDYQARSRKGGKVCYFNFALAKEMGLIPKRHSDRLNQDLKKTLLYLFGIQIINEYDLAHDVKIPPKDIRPHAFMATRYLQLQHPDKKGIYSGDGRGIWNGQFKGRHGTWDVSSSGSGATRLSPAFAANQKYIKTGDPVVAYGNGRADIIDGMSSAVMSEIFHQNQIRTERVLALIAYPDGTSVNVRAYPNLMRPAHLFHYLKQNNLTGLKGALDYYFTRQISNKNFPNIKSQKKLYDFFLKSVCLDFAKIAAKFENEYIFCWMDWDGDNILMNGGIIDYGSVRQFGLYHHEYRYDDVEQMSTSIKEQCRKARYTVQTFAQLIDYAKTGKKKRIGLYSKHPILKEFDKQFQRSRVAGTLYKMGFSQPEIKKILSQSSLKKKAIDFHSIYSYFEMMSARRGFYKVNDGVTRDAIFCMRDLMRELPKMYLAGSTEINAKTFIDVLKSQYASVRDLKITKSRKVKIESFQKSYRSLVKTVAKIKKIDERTLLTDMSRRSAIINRYERVTGDGILHITQKLLKLSKKVSHDELYPLIRAFVLRHVLRPENLNFEWLQDKTLRNKNILKVFKSMIKVVKESREGL